MKNILITGSNGFIGQYLHKYFKYKNANLIFATTSNSTGKDFCKVNSLYSNISTVLENISIDVIIHAASIIPKSFSDSNFKLFQDNTIMMNNLSEFAINRQVEKFIYLSSFGSMTNVLKYDIKDYYTLSKISGEHICAIMENYNIKTASLRLTSPFGEFCTAKNVLNTFVDLALKEQDINVYGSGQRKQNFVYAENINRCIQKCIECETQGIYDLVSETSISMINLANLIKKITNSKSKIVLGLHDDPLENVKLCNFSLNRLKSELNYNEDIPFEIALSEYIVWKKKIS